MGQEESTLLDPSVPPRNLSARTIDAVAEYIQSGKVKRIVVLTGAGISTAAGIPDFRSPKTGLYSNLARLNLPHAEAVFDIDYFRENPDPFYILANELYPGKFYPTISHAFISLLAKKGLLQMLFTQNIDCLERRAGVPSEKVVEAHGSFATQRCIDCKTEYPDDEMKEHVFANKVPRCKEDGCGGLVKPDIVFFGEPLPKRFDHNAQITALADLVLIIGTSLSVYPFAGLPELAAPGRPRVLFNMERVGKLGTRTDDVIQTGPCDDGIRALAQKLGWEKELDRHWRGIVGNKEADRQMKGYREHEEEVEDEVERLVKGVEDQLNFEEHAEEQEQKDAVGKGNTEIDTASGSLLMKHASGMESAEDLPSLLEAKEKEKHGQKAASTSADNEADKAVSLSPESKNGTSGVLSSQEAKKTTSNQAKDTSAGA
ncbi:sir2 family protein [Sarocladium implicatum]|nr:sir2 family protein [Sarocladium implicatum]